MEKVNFLCTLRKRDTKTIEIPLVITYHPLRRDFTSDIRKRLYIFYLNKGTKEIFTPGPMLSFQGARKFDSHFVRTKLHHLERSVGSFKCNCKPCQVCLNGTVIKTFSSTVTKEKVLN